MNENKKQTIMAFIRLACMLAATGCTMFGIAVDANDIFVGVMLVVSVLAYIWAWWKNNNVSKAATEAQRVLEELKKGVSVEIETDMEIVDEDEADAR